MRQDLLRRRIQRDLPPHPEMAEIDHPNAPAIAVGHKAEPKKARRPRLCTPRAKRRYTTDHQLAPRNEPTLHKLHSNCLHIVTPSAAGKRRQFAQLS